MNVADALARSRCFRGVDRHQLAEFLHAMELRSFQRNQPLWREGDGKSRLAFVASGRIKLVRHRASGKDLIVNILGPGQLVDGGLTGDDDAAASVIGLAQGTVATIDRQTFLSRLRNHASVAVNLAMHLAEDKDALMVRLDEISAGSVEARLASLLLRLAEQEGVDTDEGTRLTIPLSRQDLADLVDTTIETTIRVMSRWNRDGLVLTLRDGFLIPDLDALEEHVD